MIPVAGRQTPISVKTRAPIPKAKIRDCMVALSKVRATAPIAMGQVLLSNVCGTGIDMIATKNLP